MADRHVVYKQCLKELADSMGISVSFMAKFDSSQAGSSCHIHMSLWQDGKNAFAGDQPLGPVLGSDIFRWFLGGWIGHVPDVMPFYARTINSYKRYVDASWAPTRLAWSDDNRTAGFRVVGRDLPADRMPDTWADCNPYLAFAASWHPAWMGLKINRSHRHVLKVIFMRRDICPGCLIPCRSRLTGLLPANSIGRLLEQK